VKDAGSEWPGDVRFDPFATDLFALRRTPLCADIVAEAGD
jgi:hypothetical protein